MNKTELVAAVAAKAEISKKDAEKAVAAVFGAVEDALASGDKVARASYDVKTGDIIEIRMGENLIRAEVLAVNEYATKDNAAQMYKIL